MMATHEQILRKHCADLSANDAARVRQIVRMFPHSNARFLRLLAASEDARSACERGDGAFVFALAAAEHLRGKWDVFDVRCEPNKHAGPLRCLARRIGDRRDDTLGWLKLPGAKRILRKIPAQECTPEVLAGLSLALWLHDKSLHHVPVVRAAHGLVLPQLLFWVSSALIHELASVEGLAAARALEQRARQLCADLRDLEDDRAGLRLHSLAAFQRECDRAAKARADLALAMQGDTSHMVTVPLTTAEQAFATPLRTLPELQAEGATMRHCVGSVAFLREAAGGRLCAWSIQRDDARYTVAISQNDDGSWSVHDVKGFANAEAPEWLHDWAERLAYRADLGPVVSVAPAQRGGA